MCINPHIKRQRKAVFMSEVSEPTDMSTQFHVDSKI